jgi:hypothetical protein
MDYGLWVMGYGWWIWYGLGMAFVTRNAADDGREGTESV